VERQDEEGWEFAGYGLCLGYTLDHNAKPMGKWLLMRYASLATFPPREMHLRLQPPHVVKGRFHSDDRSQEIRMIKIALMPAAAAASGPEPRERDPEEEQQREGQARVLRFRRPPDEGPSRA
jgi:hypothetical protein